MSLKRLIKFSKTIGFRVAAWYSSIFIFSALLLFFAAYYFFSFTLKNQDHEEVLLELDHISSLYKAGGINAVTNFMVKNHSSPRTKPLFVRISDKTNRTCSIISPELWKDFDTSKLDKLFLDDDRIWIQLSAIENDYVLEISPARLARNHRIQVGISSEGRKKTLHGFRNVGFFIMIPIFIIGLIGGSFLSYSTLRPIRSIIRTVRSLDIKKASGKVPITETGDEITELAILFNTMLDNINRLIRGMKNSLDNVAHDLRTPMTKFRNRTEMALRANNDPDLLKDALEKGVEESNSILKMLDILMDISEAETGIMNINRHLVDVSVLIDKIADMYQYVAEEKGIIFKISTPINIQIEIDSDRIGQAIANILDNAIKYTPSGGIVTIEAQQIKNELLIKIQDTGVGISSEDLPMIWERLYRGGKNQTEKGLGLGLSLVKGIIEAHNGRIIAISEPGKGSTFTISLPGRPLNPS
ncbi:MAG: hypothetical protein C0403_02225 [Desulfobacterium sp.]|nr:hypothetical protein [Desulfobacterium sp.]